MVEAQAVAERAPAPAVALAVEHLSHRFGHDEVLNDVSFSVRSGELFGFVGPNGAGKTTTIRIIATLLAPTAGRVLVDGIDVSLEPERARRRIGYLPDHAGAYDKLTVRAYLTFFARAFGLDPEVVVGTRLVMTDTTALADRRIGSLSRGQRQRVQLARVLLHDPALLVLDEPTSNLDPRARIEIRDLLVALRRQGKTIFLSSHILAELDEVCSSIGVLERGRLVACGALKDIEASLRAAYGSRYGAEAPAVAQQPSAGTEQATGSAAAGAASGPNEGGASAPAPAGTAPERVRLRVLGSAEAAAGLLRGGPGVVAVEVAGDEVAVVLYGGEPAIGAMIRHLAGYGTMIVGVRVERPDLERMFLELTQRDGA